MLLTGNLIINKLKDLKINYFVPNSFNLNFFYMSKILKKKLLFFNLIFSIKLDSKYCRNILLSNSVLMAKASNSFKKYSSNFINS